MENWQKIEIIITTVADYYGIKWQELWLRAVRTRTLAPMRKNMTKLIAEHLGLNRFQVQDYLHGFDVQMVKRYVEGAKDFHYDRISHEISMQLTTQQKRAS